jgi:hypothetical protein
MHTRCMKGEEVERTIPPTTGFAPFSFFSIDQERSIKSMRRRQISKNLLKKKSENIEGYFLSKS